MPLNLDQMPLKQQPLPFYLPLQLTRCQAAGEVPAAACTDPGPSDVPAELMRVMLWGHGRALWTLEERWVGHGGHQGPCRAVSSPGCISSCCMAPDFFLLLLLLQQVPADESGWKPVRGLQHEDLPPTPPALHGVLHLPPPRKAAWRGLREVLEWKARVGLLDVGGDRRRHFRQLNKELATKNKSCSRFHC